MNKEYKIGDKVTFESLSGIKTGTIVEVKGNFVTVMVGKYKYFTNIKDIK